MEEVKGHFALKDNNLKSIATKAILYITFFV
jgi:hypothetical protein